MARSVKNYTPKWIGSGSR